jgi:phosphoglycolate phosphatase
VIETDAALHALIAATRCLLLDFDGPICAVFGGQVSAPAVARRLQVVIGGKSAPAPEDPFDVFRAAAATGDCALVRRVEAAFARAELEAVKTAPATDQVAEVIQAAHASGRRVAIVSNNSAAAVEQHLDRHRLRVDLVVGRAGPDASLLKPDPHLVNQALRRLELDAEACTMVGDSVSDIIAGKRSGVSTIGYANKPHKHELLTHAGADVVLGELEPLVEALGTT